MSSNKANPKERAPRLWIIYALLGIILIPIFTVRFFLYDFYSIPSGNMIPTINVGDIVIVDKHIYKAAANGESDSTKPEHGEIIAFHPPHDPNTTFLKRVIGIPGDVIAFSDKRLTINGKPVETHDVDSITLAETLGSTPYTVQYVNEQSSYRSFFGTVPSNHYFVMGDNRDNSLDSRVWGFVPAESLVGKVVTIW